VTTAPHQRSGELSNAEILLWQGKFRRTFAVVVGFGTIALKWAEVLSSDSVVARRIGTHPALLIGLSLIVVYLAFNEAMLAMVSRRVEAESGAIVTAVVADMTLLFGVMFVVTPPAEYPRGLIVSIFAVLLTQF